MLWKTGIFRGKHVIQENEFFITNKLSVVIEDQEQAELFKRGHTETEKVEKRRAQQQTRRSRGHRLHNLNQLKFWRENGNLRLSSPRLSRRRHRENVRILSSLLTGHGARSRFIKAVHMN